MSTPRGGRRLHHAGIAPRSDGPPDSSSGGLRSGRNRVGLARPSGEAAHPLSVLSARGANRAAGVGGRTGLAARVSSGGLGGTPTLGGPDVGQMRPLGRAQTARVNARQAQASAQARAAEQPRRSGGFGGPTAPVAGRRAGNSTPRRRGASIPQNPQQAAAAMSRENVELQAALDTVMDAEVSPATRAAAAYGTPAALPGSKRKPEASPAAAAAKGKAAKRQGLEDLSPGDACSSSPIADAAVAAEVSADSDCCPVCLCEMEQGEHAIFITSCGHRYHFKCLRSCLLNKTTNCPVCRREFNSMTPPLQRPRPKGRSVASLVERNVVVVCSGAPILEHTFHEGNTVNGLLSIDELGRILPIPPDGFSGDDMRRVQCLTKIHVSMPPSSFWRIGEATRELFLADLSGVSELQREVLEQTATRLSQTH